MKLFKKKQKNVEQDVVSAILNPETLTVNPEPATVGELEKIIKTTDSMNIVSAIQGKENVDSSKKPRDLNNVKEAIYRSFDLARRKIATEYEQIIVSGNYVDNPFLAVQICVKNFEKKWNVEYVESVVKKFTDALPEQLSLGRTILISNDLVIEPIIYVDKVLPSWKITPDFALLSNALKWEDIVEKLIEEGQLSQGDREIISELVDAINTDIKNGFYVKLARFIIVQIYPGSAQKIVLFSNDTLKKMNDIYTRFLKTGERKQINKYDTTAHYDKTHETIKSEFLNQDSRDAIEGEPFVPKDLEVEITPEIEEKTEKEKAALEADKEIESIEEAEDLELEQEVSKTKKSSKKKSSAKKSTAKAVIVKPVVKEVKTAATKPAAKKAEVKKAATKPVAKKAEVKKAVAKPAAKKPVAKKPAAKAKKK